MHAKQERVESLNYYNDIHGVLNTCVFVCFETKQGVLFIGRQAVYMSPYTLSRICITYIH